MTFVLIPGAGGVVMLEAVKTTLALRPQVVAEPARARRREALSPQPAGFSPPAEDAVALRDRGWGMTPDRQLTGLAR